jgi:hypothetical protein
LEISGAVIDIDFLSAREAGANSTSPQGQFKDFILPEGDLRIGGDVLCF